MRVNISHCNVDGKDTIIWFYRAEAGYIGKYDADKKECKKYQGHSNEFQNTFQFPYLFLRSQSEYNFRILFFKTPHRW